MSDPIEALIKEIAVKHSVAVSRDDPIMILQTINQRLLQETGAAQQKILGQFKSELEALSCRWSEDAKNKAERALNAALAASRDAMNQTMQEGAKKTIQIVKEEIDSMTDHLTAPLREAKRVAYMNLVAAAMVVFAAGIAFFASIQ